MMVTDHTKTSTELKSMVPVDLKAAVPAWLDDASQKMIAKLRDVSPAGAGLFLEVSVRPRAGRATRGISRAPGQRPLPACRPEGQGRRDDASRLSWSTR